MQDRPLSFGSVSTPILTSRFLTSPLAHDIAQPPARVRPFTDSSDPPEKRPDSQSSGMTVRRISSSVRPNVGDDDVFTTQPHTRTLRRRSSRLSKWLEDLRVESPTVQQLDISADTETVGTECNPYLAYPHLSPATVRRSMDDARSMHDYVVVNDGDVQEYVPPEEPTDVKGSHGPPTLADTMSPSHRSTIWLNTPPSQHHFHQPVISSSPAVSSTSHSPSRVSMFQRSHVTSNSEAINPYHHSRSLSLQTSHPVAEARSEERGIHSNPSSWRWRPSVLGHFVSLSDVDTHSSTRDSPGSSRPSMSSTTTSSSYATPSTNIMYEDGASYVPPLTPQKSNFFGSLRSRSQKAVTSSLSLFKTDTSSSFPTSLSSPASEPELSQPPGFPSTLARKSSTIRLPFSPKSRTPLDSNLPNIFVEAPDGTRPRIVYTGKSHAPRVSLSSIGSQSRSTKKKLVIAGIARNDVKRLEAAQKWCQSFGEVDQITRMPNGDLHVNFHKAEVAETVCRVRAKVYIAGVGSVHLSWFSGNKRP